MARAEVDAKVGCMPRPPLLLLLLRIQLCADPLAGCRCAALRLLSTTCCGRT